MSAQSTTHGATSSARKPECLSMTGYATARCEHQGWSIRVSVKSVNHRFLDVKLRMPESLEPYEIRLRQAVRERIHRGHVDIHVSVEPGKAAPVHVNQELLQAYLRAAEELRQQTEAKAELDLVSLLRLPGVIGGLAPELPDSEEEQEALGKILETQLREALTKMDEMRRAEGRHLSEELRERTMRIGLLVEEAALLAERSDISEELDRLRSHLQQFAQLLDGAGELGKKLDFLLQEMQREANTMLSKTPGVESEALAITGIALEIKAEIEKLREQVQNIE